MEVTLRAAYIALQIDPFIALIFVLPYTVYGYVRTKLQMFGKIPTYVGMLGRINLTLKTYYAAKKNICIIHIP